MLSELLDLVIPTRCAGCGARGDPCCARCHAVWGDAREIVRTPTAGLAQVFALARYQGVARRLLIAYKERGRRDLAPALGGALAEALSVLPGLSRQSAQSGTESGTATGTGRGTGPTPPPKICLVPAPSRAPASRVRGGPHVQRLAEAAAGGLAARGFEVAVAPALRLAGGTRDAVGLNKAARAANLSGRLGFHHAGAPPPGLPVVVLDDLITTGATAAACVRALADAGVAVTAVLTLLAAG